MAREGESIVPPLKIGASGTATALKRGKPDANRTQIASGIRWINDLSAASDWHDRCFAG